jgi:hypothetical protein
MTHTHEHGHEHHHSHETTDILSFDEKMVKLLEHWIKHNEDHAISYRDWAKKAKENNMSDTVSLLEDAADMTVEMNSKFEKALALMKK